MSNNQEQPWYSVFNDAFFLTLAGVIFSFMGLSVNAIIKSRCQECSFCFGLFSCKRSPEVDIEEIEHGITARTPPTQV